MALQRNFKFISIVGFVTILQATWECTLLANWPGLLNGYDMPHLRHHRYH
jgi:hypothetical protein